jgi:hypothetical protein
MSEFYVYLHHRPDGAPFYVGKGHGGRAREFAKGRGRHYKNIIEKHGKENIIVHIFPCASEEEAFAEEIRQIARLRAEGHSLVNRTDGGEGTKGLTRGPETRAKISAAKLGTKSSPEAIAKMRANHRRAKPWLGKSISPETKEKLRVANTGKKQSAETIALKAAALRGRKRSPEECAAISRGRLKYFSDLKGATNG